VIVDRLHFPTGFTRAARPALGKIDEVRVLDGLMRELPVSDNTAPLGTSLFVRGWAYLDDPLRPAAAIMLSIGATTFQPLLGKERPDLGAAFGAGAATHAPFEAVYPLVTVPLGRALLCVHAFEDDGLTYHTVPGDDSIDVVASRMMFPAIPQSVQSDIALRIDSVRTMHGPTTRNGADISVACGAIVVIDGTAVDAVQGAPAGGIYAIVDGEHYTCGVPGLASGTTHDGFSLRVTTGRLAPGDHVVRLAVMTADRLRYVMCEGFRLTVTAD